MEVFSPGFRLTFLARIKFRLRNKHKGWRAFMFCIFRFGILYDLILFFNYIKKFVYFFVCIYWCLCQWNVSSIFDFIIWKSYCLAYLKVVQSNTIWSIVSLCSVIQRRRSGVNYCFIWYNLLFVLAASKFHRRYLQFNFIVLNPEESRCCSFNRLYE